MMETGAPHIDQDRLWGDLMALAAITDPGQPYTRRSFSGRFLEGRAWLRDRFLAAGLTVRLDAAANLIGRLEGSDADAPAIMLGSHSDTVPSGGRFDGTAGILTALEAVRALRGAGYAARHPIEIVDFLAEEPSEYRVSCVGSRAMAGALDAKSLASTNALGETLADAIRRVGGEPGRIGSALRTDIAGYFELHIEQGIVLETHGVELGLVTSIVGILRIEAIFEGAADHAGTTPLAYRRDASLAAAAFTLFVADNAMRFASRQEGHFVATAGFLDLHPNAVNVVPGRARMILDIRAEKAAMLDEFQAQLEHESVAIAKRHHVERTGFTILSRNDPTACDASLRGLLGQGAAAHGFSAMTLASGAGHDAAFLARVTPSAMLFVPCRLGKSHCPEEWAEPGALAKGAAVLAEAIRLFDGRNG